MIGLSGKQRTSFKFGDVCFRACEFAIQVFHQIFALLCVGLFLRQVDIRFYVADHCIQFRLGGNLVVGTFPFAEYTLSLFLVVPEIRLRYFCFEGFQFFTEMRSVKDNSAQARCVALDLHSDTVNLQESCSLPKSL